MPDDSLEILRVRPGICYAARDDVLLLYYRVSPDVDDLKKREPLLDALCRRHPGGGAFLSVIETSYGGALPDSAARAETARQVEAHKEVLRAGAMVLVGDGLKTSLVRTLLRGLLFFRKGHIELRFFASIEEAASWCVSRLGHQGADKTRRAGRVIDAIAVLAEEAGYPPRASGPPREPGAD